MPSVKCIFHSSAPRQAFVESLRGGEPSGSVKLVSNVKARPANTVGGLVLAVFAFDHSGEYSTRSTGTFVGGWASGARVAPAVTARTSAGKASPRACAR